jgi:hypothetical protein
MTQHALDKSDVNAILKQGIEAASKAIAFVMEEANRAAHFETEEYIDEVCAAITALEEFIAKAKGIAAIL